nr:MAG TPA: hypothetical protein [Caudoviricetes sp.]
MRNKSRFYIMTRFGLDKRDYFCNSRSFRS